MHRFYYRFERSSNSNYFYHWGGRAHLCHLPLATYIIHFMKMDIFIERIMNFFIIITRNYIHKYIHLEALKRTNKLKRKVR